MFTIKRFATSSRLPTLPEVALRLVKLAQQEEPDYDEVSRIIKSDPVICGKILKTVNSALFGFRRKVESIEQAVPILGVTLLRTIILSFHLARHKTEQATLEPVLQTLWRSSLTQAVFAELIAEQIDNADPPSCFLAAMLQDIGILAMVSEAPLEYVSNVVAHAEFPNVVVPERNQFGFSHVEVSLAILENWGLTESFGTAVKHHHDYLASPTADPARQLGSILQAANMGTTVLFSGGSADRSLDSTLDQWTDFLKVQFGLTELKAAEIIEDVNSRVAEYSVLFNFDIGEGIETEEVVIAAKDMLQEIALRNQLECLDKKRSNANADVQSDELYRDSLSGLYNRRFMNKHLNNRLATSVRRKAPIAILFIDVDKFKQINDSHGHVSGDLAIQHVAKWLTRSIRKDDLAIRLGGDEFLVMLQHVTEVDFEQIANRIVNDIPQLQIRGDQMIDISLSAGCIYYQPVRGDVPNANWLIDQADQSMYNVKKSGGDSVAIQKFVGIGLAPV